MSSSADALREEIREVINSTKDTLKPISPKDGVNEFLSHKAVEVRSQTVDEYRRKLGHFLEFCERDGIENLNQLDGRTIQNYSRYRRFEAPARDEPLATKTMRDEMYLFRDFISYLERIEASRADLSKKVDVPELGPGDGIRDVKIDVERVNRILEYLDKYEYATREHVVWSFLAHTGRRPGGLYAIDLDDLHLNGDDPYIELRHRPGETELKNEERGETEIHLTQSVAQIFRDYVERSRIDTTTENGREPFLTSRHGRLSKSTFRKYVYRYSRPCVVGGNCPHDCEIESCQAAGSSEKAWECPSSRPSYALRHAYITWKRSEGVPDQFISGRCDVSPEVLDKHYDERTESEKRNLRREVFDEFRNGSSGGDPR
jgi:site-specific recombinase XerD